MYSNGAMVGGEPILYALKRHNQPTTPVNPIKTSINKAVKLYMYQSDIINLNSSIVSREKETLWRDNFNMNENIIAEI